MKIESGYTPELIESVVRLHAEYYSRTHGFGQEFEAIVASGLTEFMPRSGREPNSIWYVRNDKGDIAASLIIDGEDLADNSGHLRWFIADNTVRGTGVGNQLMRCAVDFCDQQGFERCVLWTFKGLDAARSLYEKFGFAMTEERNGDQWGKVVTEQKFERPSNAISKF